MARYEVEVEGRFTAVIEVEADNVEDAESEAVNVFENDNYVVTKRGAEGWDYTSIETCEMG